LAQQAKAERARAGVLDHWYDGPEGREVLRTVKEEEMRMNGSLASAIFIGMGRGK
jgi:hypothetical protein